MLDINNLNKLKQINLKNIQISFDGLRETHNKRRRHKKYGGTYDKIIENLDGVAEFALKNKIFLNLSITIDKNNKSEYADIFDLLNKRYAELYESGLMSIPINFVESRDESNKCKLNSAERLDFIFELLKTNTVSKKYLLNLLFPAQNVMPCMMRKINNYGIGASGNIYKCLEDFDNFDKAIGNINTKSIDDLSLSYQAVGADVFDDATCKECAYLPLCAGGCPYDVVNKTKNNYTDNCTMFKNKIQEVLTKYYKYTK